MMKYKYRDKEWLENALLIYGSPKVIAEKCNVHRNVITKWMKKLNLDKEYKYRDKEWLDNAISEHIYISEVAKIYGYSESALKNWCEKFNIKYTNKNKKLVNRKTELDYEYFKKIDTQEKAYWLGFLMADGCVSKTSPIGPYNRLSVNCKKDDINHIEKFKEALQCGYSIDTKLKENKTYNFSSEVSELRVNSELMVNDLIKLGICPNKTGKESMPKLRKNFIRHFIRGFFDGDGSITCKKTFRISSMSKDILENINSHFKDTLDVELKIYCSNSYSKPFYTFDSNHSKKNKIILDYLYKDAIIFLDRKYDRYVNLYCPTTK